MCRWAMSTRVYEKLRVDAISQTKKEEEEKKKKAREHKERAPLGGFRRRVFYRFLVCDSCDPVEGSGSSNRGSFATWICAKGSDWRGRT